MLIATAFHEVRDALDQAQRDAAREHRELGTSLSIANRERKRLEDMIEAAIELLAERCTGEYPETEAAEAIVERFDRRRAEARETQAVVS